MKKPICLLMVLILVMCAGCAKENSEEIKTTPGARIDWPYYGTPEELVDAATHIFEGRIIDISADVISVRTGKPQRTPIGSEDDPSEYELVTVYTVLVIRAYKGQTNLIERIIFPGGNWEEMLVQQKQALERAEMYDPDKGVPDVMPTRDLERDTTYLFCVKDWLGGYKGPTSHQHFALEENSNLAKSQPVYDPNEIKKLLPYVPHPLLICSAVVAVLLTVLFILQKKQRKQLTPQAPETE